MPLIWLSLNRDVFMEFSLGKGTGKFHFWRRLSGGVLPAYQQVQPREATMVPEAQARKTRITAWFQGCCGKW
jgi:hypothetical protein